MLCYCLDGEAIMSLILCSIFCYRDALKPNNECRARVRREKNRRHCFISGVLPNEVSFIWYVHQTASIHLQNVLCLLLFVVCVRASVLWLIPLTPTLNIVNHRLVFQHIVVHGFLFFCMDASAWARKKIFLHWNVYIEPTAKIALMHSHFHIHNLNGFSLWSQFVFICVRVKSLASFRWIQMYPSLRLEN